jgi:hypothetical protein
MLSESEWFPECHHVSTHFFTAFSGWLEKTPENLPFAEVFWLQ